MWPPKRPGQVCWNGARRWHPSTGLPCQRTPGRPRATARVCKERHAWISKALQEIINLRNKPHGRLFLLPRKKFGKFGTFESSVGSATAGKQARVKRTNRRAVLGRCVGRVFWVFAPERCRAYRSAGVREGVGEKVLKSERKTEGYPAYSTVLD